MILSDRVARAIAAGEVVQVFRPWSVPRVRVGSTLHTSAGIVQIVSVEAIDPQRISDTDARKAGEPSAHAVRASCRGDQTDPVFRITVRFLGPDERVELRSRADLSQRDIDEIRTALSRLDRASRRGPWTADILDVVARNPGHRAADLAELMGRDKESFKLDVRKLKNLGLTHSLTVGYELSPRGAEYRRQVAENN
ncbi:hypothetical protein [Nocardia goodfellowii]|uniref:ASCH domain-containing protein n=1 Tax=Nocardia goodfellowii TaxID=882446 RepID=A0ABS4QER6_9NOCA|nr:hypothetical protein [Nocardia goodfellowii]MBP2189579.1 hypothetical protein [Nocardia goodfellowii]